jgi:hypothetical protein
VHPPQSEPTKLPEQRRRNSAKPVRLVYVLYAFQLEPDARTYKVGLFFEPFAERESGLLLLQRKSFLCLVTHNLFPCANKHVVKSGITLLYTYTHIRACVLSLRAHTLAFLMLRNFHRALSHLYLRQIDDEQSNAFGSNLILYHDTGLCVTLESFH